MTCGMFYCHTRTEEQRGTQARPLNLSSWAVEVEAKLGFMFSGAPLLSTSS